MVEVYIYITQINPTNVTQVKVKKVSSGKKEYDKNIYDFSKLKVAL